MGYICCNTLFGKPDSFLDAFIIFMNISNNEPANNEEQLHAGVSFDKQPVAKDIGRMKQHGVKYREPSQVLYRLKGFFKPNCSLDDDSDQS